jgi:hypothetical protein
VIHRLAELVAYHVLLGVCRQVDAAGQQAIQAILQLRAPKLQLLGVGIRGRLDLLLDPVDLVVQRLVVRIQAAEPGAFGLEVVETLFQFDGCSCASVAVVRRESCRSCMPDLTVPGSSA